MKLKNFTLSHKTEEILVQLKGKIQEVGHGKICLYAKKKKLTIWGRFKASLALTILLG